jgi:glycosyltransferase involved in cell wall biosynthesis
MNLSVVLPAYNEGPLLGELHRRLHAVLDPLALDYELIFIDDGSTDDTWPRLRARQ